MARQSQIKKAFQDIWLSRDKDGTSCWKYNINLWIDKPEMAECGMYEVEDSTVGWIGALTIDEFEKLFGYLPKFDSCELCRISIQPRKGVQVHAMRTSKKQAPSRADESCSTPAAHNVKGDGKVKLKLKLKTK